ncbi:MAG: hypothetical protein DRG33_08110 [Deltaproteobacteria bacterium]|nr:MAG: hypothetical protein DRG33_08110 [Deltaproteobacteria bacterium]
MIHPQFLSKWDKSQLPVLNRIIDAIVKHINRWTFGSGYKHDIEVTDTGTADTDFTVNHNLGYTPSGWLLYYQNKPGSLYVVSWDSTSAVFRFSNDNAHIKFRLF